MEQVKEDISLRVHALDLKGSASDGPGIRAVVFLQGCDRHCKGCHNKETWALDGGKLMSVDEVVDRLIASHIDRVTISGGEPLLQPQGVMSLIRKLKAKGIDDICIYTGLAECDVPRDIQANLRYLKTGEFRLEEKTTVKPYVGSRNQEFRRVA